MTDRIYPTYEADDQYAKRNTASQASAPPLYGSSAAIQMPEKAVHKEQEKGLMSRYDHHDQTRQSDDHVYAAPPPVYESYGGAKGYTGESYALAPMGRRCRRRRRSPCCYCLISFVGTLWTLILIAGIAALVVYLVVKPIRKPKYEVEGIEVEEFNVTNGGARLLNTEMDLQVQATNPNKKIGIDYDYIEVKVFYDGVEIGEGSIPGFYQGHRNTILLTIPIEGHDVTLSSTAVSALQSNASVEMAAEARTRAGVKIGRWKSWRHTFHIHCSFELSSSPHPGHLTVLSSSCKLKKPRFFGFHI